MKKDLFGFNGLNNYILLVEDTYVTVCIKVEAKTNWTVAKVSRRIITELNKLRHDK